MKYFLAGFWLGTGGILMVVLLRWTPPDAAHALLATSVALVYGYLALLNAYRALDGEDA
jgi:hypothetical protein